MRKTQKKYIRLAVMAALAAALTAGASPLARAAGNSVVSNTTLPSGGAWQFGGSGAFTEADNVMNITQTGANAMITWEDFSIGANAAVNFYGPAADFNVLNYVTGGNASQIYGKLSAADGNVYLVNPNGIQIGNTAEINVGSLHLANKTLTGWEDWNGNTDIAAGVKASTALSSAELMSLGYIQASKIVFEGQRVVVDMDRLSGLAESTRAVTILSRESDKTDNRTYDVVLGMDDYDDADGKWKGLVSFGEVTAPDALTAGSEITDNTNNETLMHFYAYKWIKDGAELGRIGSDDDQYSLDGDYALRYSIDLTGNKQSPIGETKDKAFTGKLDGLGNNIFGLNIDTTESGNGATGLFGYTNGAIIGNFKLIAGTDGVSITGNDNVGSVIGYAENTKLTNVTSTLQVTGGKNVGGLVGYAVYTENTNNDSSVYQNLLNTGTVQGKENVGGLIGALVNETDASGKSTLGVDEAGTDYESVSHNLGRVSGLDTASGTSTTYSHNIGGLVGYAKNSVIGGVSEADSSYTDHDNAVYNAARIVGGYNVGGIVGAAEGTKLYNVSNESQVTATGWIAEDYTFHTDYTTNGYSSGGTKTISVRMSNVGGIAGSTAEASEIRGASNEGDISAKLVSANGQSWTSHTSDTYLSPDYFDHYEGGNVGGIVGRAVNTNIADVTNLESDIRGSMNVGGIAGYYATVNAEGGMDTAGTADYRISNATNDGGDIMGTGGILTDKSNGRDVFATEITRQNYDADNQERYIIGNIGGVAGSMEGIGAHIENSGNRGTVHTQTITDSSKIEDTAKAANIGGVVGNLDRAELSNYTDEARLAVIKGTASGGLTADPSGKTGAASAVISNSYNSGKVTGFTNIGGILGFSYNGSLSNVDNYGDINTTRKSSGDRTPVNMAGIVGDTTEKTSARTVIYGAYNHGTIGDEGFTYAGRHVGGIVGRLSGVVEKAENQGDIYNASNVVGGIAGYWYSGQLKNIFNVGNITVVNDNNAESQVGGIVGSVDLSGGNTTGGINTALSITNAYNLGSLRSFKRNSSWDDYLGGIVGYVANWDNSSNTLRISNVYTGGNLYAKNGSVGAVYAGTKDSRWGSYITVSNVYYISPTDTNYTQSLSDSSRVTVISNNNKDDKDKYGGFSFSSQTDGKVEAAAGTDLEDGWRIYAGSTPILNAFLSNAENYFSQDENWNGFKKDNEKGSVQYGTAYNPLLTIVKSETDQAFSWGDLGLNQRSSFALYGIDGAAPDLDLSDFNVTGGNGTFIGTLYADGNLFLTNYNGGISLGESSELYGNGVYVYAGDTVNVMGSITSTGADGTDDSSGNIAVFGGEVNIYGKLTAAGAGESVTIAGQGDSLSDDTSTDTDGNGSSTVSDYSQKMIRMRDRFVKKVSYTDENGNTADGAARDGDLLFRTIEYLAYETDEDGDGVPEPHYITPSGSGDINLFYGNLGTGKLTAKGEGKLEVIADGDIFVDSDLAVSGDVELRSEDLTGSEVILDISNIGKQEYNGKLNVKAVHEFLDAHKWIDWETYDFYHQLSMEGGSVKIAVDAWDADHELSGVKGNYNYEQYDYEGRSLKEVLQGMTINAGEGTSSTIANAMNYLYTWVSDAEQLDGIQKYVDRGGKYKDEFLDYKFALKDNIDASTITDFSSIGVRDADGNEGAFTGTFDGRDLRISGLTAKNGLFSDLGTRTAIEVSFGEEEEVQHYGIVEDLKIYSGTFTATESNKNVGAVAGKNSEGVVTGYTGLGNTVIGVTDGYTGGVIGYDQSTINESEDQSTVISNGSTAGGIAGYVEKGAVIFDLQTNSAVTSTGGTGSRMGGIVGLNYGSVSNVSAHGVTGKEGLTSAAGGIAGANYGRIREAYNESILHGSDGIGGIAGVNDKDSSNDSTEAAFDRDGEPVYILNADGTVRVRGRDSDGERIYVDANGNHVSETDADGAYIYINADTGKRIYYYDKDTGESITFVATEDGNIRVSDYDSSGWVMLSKDGKRVTGKLDEDWNYYYVDADGTRYDAADISEGYVDAAGNCYFASDVTTNGLIDIDGTIYDAWDVSIENGYMNAAGEIVSGAQGYVDSYGNYYTEAEVTTLQLAVSGRITDVANALDIKGDTVSTNIGGLIGDQKSGTLETGRNTGTVSGTTNVGGLVGRNGGGSELRDLENAPQASISGVTNVGGIAGANEGSIIVDVSSLNNKGTISGVTNVGGITGYNTQGGLVKNVGSDMDLYVNEAALADLQKTDASAKAQYFGGVVGLNEGTVINADNTGDIHADGASYVGGIIGKNTATGSFVDESGMASQLYSNSGSVTGASYVGGIIGLNEATEASMLYAENTGTVTATEGGAGGIFGEFTGSISYGILTNGGTVIGSGTADDGSGTGGIIGVNKGAITGAVLANEGFVYSAKNVGGIIGVNGGNITDSSLQNQVSAVVYGKENVGGIVGLNNASIAGSRDADDTYYENTVYNNGKVGAYKYTAGTNGAEDTYEKMSGTNIGGLIGNNAAGSSLTLAYNTGAVDAGSSTNVGGVVGYNAGSVDQVFNSIAVRSGNEKDGYTWSAGSVEGSMNVGGIIGNNASGASLTNAYNTTTVSGTANRGFIAGSNEGTVKYVYSTGSRASTTGISLIGANNEAEYGYRLYIDEDGYKQKETYSGFDFTGTDTTAAVWKIYEGKSGALLKNFLTKVSYDATKDEQKLTYNGKDQHKDIDQLIADGALTDLSGREFADYRTSKDKLINTDSSENKNAGTYSDLLWSLQIGTSGTDGDPNNLGYDLEELEYSIEKAKLTVTLEDIYRIYGNGTKYDAAKTAADRQQTDYSDRYTVVGWADGEETAVKAALADGFSETSDGAVDNLASGKTTADVGDYDWSASFTGWDGDVLKNYTVADADGNSLITNGTYTVSGEDKSHVEKATLTVDLNDVHRTYGDAAITSPEAGYSGKLADGSGFVNGDSYTFAKNITISGTADAEHDTALTGNTTGSATKDAGGSYTWTGTAAAAGTEAEQTAINKNYDIVISNDGKGTSIVDKRALSVTLDDIYRTYGDAAKYDAAKSDANRKQTDYSYGVTNWASGEENAVKAALSQGFTQKTDGAVDNAASGKTTNNAGSYNWSADFSGFADTDSVLKNYTIAGLTATDGTYTVSGTDKSHVEKAALTVGLTDVTRTYGSTDLTKGTSYGVKTGYTLVNGDTGTITINGDVPTANDGALTTVGGEVRTKDVTADGYTWSVGSDKLTGVTDLSANYDITVNAGKSVVEKKKLSLTTPTIETTYGTAPGKTVGSLTLTDGGLVYGDTVTVSDGKITEKTEGAYAANKGSRTTGDVGTYEGALTVSDITISGDKAGNYEIEGTADGTLKVNQASLTVDLGSVTRTYGDTAITAGGYTVTIADGSSLVNGDTGTITVKASADKKDGALTGNSTGKVTSNAGTYTWSAAAADLEGVANLAKNYSITISNNGKGASNVSKKAITVDLTDVTRTYGSTAFTGGTSYGVKTGYTLVNGDTGTITVAGDVSTANDGALTTAGSEVRTNDAGSYTWTISSDKLAGVTDLSTNYDVTVNAGKSSVDKKALTFTGSNVTRTYGNTALTGGTSYGVTAEGWAYDDAASLGDKLTLAETKEDDALTGKTEGRVTNDAGDYNWSGTVSGLGEGELKNYTFSGNAATVSGKSVVNKADLKVSLTDVSRTYGDAAIKSGSYTASEISGLTNGDAYTAADISVTKTADGAIDKKTGAHETAGAGSYTWSGTASSANEKLSKNYTIKVNDGTSVVDKASLTLKANDVETTYGTKFAGYGYTISGIVKGDTEEGIRSEVGGVTYENTAAEDGTNGRWTKNAGTYADAVTIEGAKDLANYTVTTDAGDAKVNKAQLTITIDDKQILEGEPVEPTGRVEGLVNGDTESDIGFSGFGVDPSVDTKVVGNYEDVIGAIIDGILRKTADGVDLDNYDLTLKPGSLTIGTSFVPQHDYWFSANPWDREAVQRERKAEIHFVGGGMSM